MAGSLHPYPITPLLSTIPLNSNVGFNNSWISVSNNFGIPLFAQLTYVTNLDDSLIYLSSLTDIVSSAIGRYDSYFIELTSLSYSINEHVDTIEPLIIETNTLLDGLTGLNSIVIDNQNVLITLTNVLTSYILELDANTDQVETLIEATNEFLNIIIGWDYSTAANQTILNNLVESLTVYYNDKTSEIITLCNVLTRI